MWDYMQQLGLNVKDTAYGEQSVMGVFDGTEIVFQTSEYDVSAGVSFSPLDLLCTPFFFLFFSFFFFFFFFSRCRS